MVLLLTAIENNADLYAPDSPLQLTNQEQTDITEALNGHLYGWNHCKYILLRLEEAYTNIHTPYNYKDISVEHVLPQHPRVGSTWLTEFPDKAVRDQYLHRLGNLVLLTQKKNSEKAKRHLAFELREVMDISEKNLEDTIAQEYRQGHSFTDFWAVYPAVIP